MLTLERSVKTYLVIGLVQGLLLWLGTAIDEPGVRYGLITAVLVGGINLLLLGESIRQRGTVWLVLGLTAVMTAISAWVLGSAGALNHFSQVSGLIALPTTPQARPSIGSMTQRKAKSFMGGVGLISTFIALFLTSLISGYFSIDGALTWIGATVVVWLFGAIAAWILPFFLVKRAVNNARD